MSPALGRIPNHLKKYVVEQYYERYTPEDQAVWRFILRQLKDFLSLHAHPCYVEGLKRTGISIERIPRIDEMDDMLAEFGWGAVPVSGFIPPAAFMEFQSLGILPIASDMRSIDHLTYTPAPDIVHEAAGHAPILINEEFAAYLKRYADVARHAILTREDLEQYAAIRKLSDVKENPESTPDQIHAAEAELEAVNQRLTRVSEAGWLSRMNWWTAEYGLIGSLQKPQIYGAGLLSSVGESRHCLSDRVRKLPLTIDCINVGYDITEPQPQLFVTPDFATLNGVLEELADRMAFRIGGIVGLERARGAGTVNTVELDSGLQISGVLESFQAEGSQVEFVRFSGPVALAAGQQQIAGHGPETHGHGFSSPLGRLVGMNRPLASTTPTDLPRLGMTAGQVATLEFESGIHLRGRLLEPRFLSGRLQLLSFAECEVRRGDQVLFSPEWGQFDLAIGEKVVRVFGGPADRPAFGDTEDFISARVPSRKISAAQSRLFSFYSAIRELREGGAANAQQRWNELSAQYLREFSAHWLAGVELVELTHLLAINGGHYLKSIEQHLRTLPGASDMASECIADGLRIADVRL